MLPPGVEHGGDGARDDAAIHAETRIRRQDDLERIVLVELPLVDDVVQAAADERRDRDDDHRVRQEPDVKPAPACLVSDDEVGRRQPDRVGDAVPVDRERPDGEGDR